MKVAFTSSNGICVDCHFGSSEAFFVWEVGQEIAHCLGTAAYLTSKARRTGSSRAPTCSRIAPSCLPPR